MRKLIANMLRNTKKMGITNRAFLMPIGDHLPAVSLFPCETLNSDGVTTAVPSTSESCHNAMLTFIGFDKCQLIFQRLQRWMRRTHVVSRHVIYIEIYYPFIIFWCGLIDVLMPPSPSFFDPPPSLGRFEKYTTMLEIAKNFTMACHNWQLCTIKTSV